MKSLKILFFTSPDCSICDDQHRILQTMARNHSIGYEKKLITTAFDLALRFGVRSAPTLVYLLDDRPVIVTPGFQSADTILASLNLIHDS
jgi:thioredoxin-related protein